MNKLDHIGIAVKNLASSNALFETLLNTSHYKTEYVAKENVNTSFFRIGETKIELVEATTEESPIAKFINRNGEGIHHIAINVENIDSEIARLKKEGFKFVSNKIKIGADNKKIIFLHPKSTNGVLVELCEDM